MNNIHTTKDGRKLLISEMSDSHLLNTINMIERKSKDGIVVEYGCICEEPYYDVTEYFGKKALTIMNYGSYTLEAKKRGLTNKQTNKTKQRS